MDEEILSERAWREYAERNERANTLPIRVEVEINHHGEREIMFTKLRKIAEVEDEEEGVRFETWEALTKRDDRPRFTVALRGKSLESHIELCKWRNTDAGTRMISKLMILSEVLLNVLLFSMIGGIIPAEVNPLDWYWMLTIGASAGIICATVAYNQVATCGKLSLECAYPNEERGTMHVCYVVGSSSGNVVEQLNAYDRYHETFTKLIDVLNTNLSHRYFKLEEDLWRQESEIKQGFQDEVHRFGSRLDRRLIVGGGKTSISGIGLPVVVAIVSLSVIVAVGAMYCIYGVA